MNRGRSLIALLSVLAACISAGSAIYSSQDPNSCPWGQSPVCSPTNQIFSPQPTPTCTNCPAGTSTFPGNMLSFYYNYMYDGTTNRGCKQCYYGYYNNQTGAEYCQDCPDGYQCSDSTIGPVPCPRGYYRSNTYNSMMMMDGNCRACPKDTYANKVGSKECTPCPSGYFCPDPTSSPIPCPKGTATDTYTPAYQLNGFEYRCQTAPPGFYVPLVGSSKLTLCPDGSYCPDPTQAIKCPLGTYRKNAPFQTTFQNGYMDIPSDSSFCIRCPRGQYANVIGSSSCIKCPVGYYCSNPTIAPTPCPTGTFASSLAGQIQCYPCPDGYYANSTGNVKCKRCPNGNYCADKAAPPKPCPIGSYSNSTMHKMACARCPAGTYAPSIGSTSCIECPYSMCCDDPNSLPTPCPYPTTPVYSSSSNYNLNGSTNSYTYST